MAINALEGSPESQQLAEPNPTKSPIDPIAPSLGQLPTPSKKDRASQLADLENEIQQTDQLIKETKTVSVNDIMADRADNNKAKAKELLKSSVK